jgi:multiple sugar transport system ATP-binding protein
MARVVWDQVTKKFGQVVAIDNLTLTAEDGEFLVLVGPSGCGKTTALRLVAGLEEPTSGHIWIGDRVVNDVPPRDRDVAMVFQSYALYPHMSVYDNMAFGLKLRGFRRPKLTGGSSRPPKSWELLTCSTASPDSFPAASASGWRWAGPSSGSRKSS